MYIQTCLYLAWQKLVYQVTLVQLQNEYKFYPNVCKFIQIGICSMKYFVPEERMAHFNEALGGKGMGDKHSIASQTGYTGLIALYPWVLDKLTNQEGRHHF